MKLTKNQLIKIIKEEISLALNEGEKWTVTHYDNLYALCKSDSPASTVKYWCYHPSSPDNEEGVIHFLNNEDKSQYVMRRGKIWDEWDEEADSDLAAELLPLVPRGE